MLSRKDGQFGLHTDFHATVHDRDVWADVTEEMVEHVLEVIGPDFVQVDCKGHAGYASYPTEVGFPAPGLRKDGLRIWREVTRKRGVALVVHYSVLWDKAAVAHRPDWAVVRADGARDRAAVSLFSPYLDELMIPQLQEVIARYDIDGVWTDADTWGVMPDYSAGAVRAFREETGMSDPPGSPGEPGWPVFMAFLRRRFRYHALKYIDALHAFRPGIQIASNGALSPSTPGLEALGVDFLSGDYMPEEAADGARVVARYWPSLDIPWDLMAWTHTKGDAQFNRSFKPAAQLQQEAACVLAQGGAWQLIVMGTRSGHLDDASLRVAGEAARFVRERESLCRDTAPLPQVALLMPETAMEENLNATGVGYRFHEINRPHLVGLLRLLLHTHHSVDVRSERQAVNGLSEFPVLAVPDCHVLPSEVVAALKGYAEEGGRLLLCGPRIAQPFARELGIRFSGPLVDMNAIYRDLEKQHKDLMFLQPEFPELHLEDDGLIADCGGRYREVDPAGSEIVAQWFPGKDTRGQGSCAASMIPFGKGWIAAIYVSLAEGYYHGQHPVLRRAVADVMRRLFPEPAVELDGPHQVEVSLKKKDGDYRIVHLVNTIGMDLSPRCAATDFIPPLHDIRVRLRVPRAPRRVAFAFGGEVRDEAYADGILAVTLGKLNIHDALVVEN